PFVTPVLTTTTSFWVSCTSAAGCEGPRTEVVATINPLPLIRTLLPGNFCPADPFVGGSITLQNAQAGVSYQLQLDGTNTQAPQVPANNGDNLIWTGLVAGNYSVEATFLATNCESESGPATVQENNTPGCSISGNNAICTGGSTSFTASGGDAGATYAWTGPGGFT